MLFESECLLSESDFFRDSTGILDWLHDRMPVILPDSEAVEKWLDPNVKEIEALKHIKQISKDQVRHGDDTPIIKHLAKNENEFSEFLCLSCQLLREMSLRINKLALFRVPLNTKF